MNIEILDTSFRRIYCLDVFESFIWTERYSSYGDFELYLPMNTTYLNFLQENNYVTIDDTDAVMIIESIEITTDVEDGDHLKITGRSLESILDRRIIWDKTTLDGKLDGQIQKLLNKCIISPDISSRKISNFKFQSANDKNVNNCSIQGQYTGDNLYETIKAICDVYNLGFKIILDNSNQFVFSLYSGHDRSYDIDALLDSSGDYILDSNSDFMLGYETSYLVEFSPSFDNLISSNYFESIENEKNVALIAGEGEAEERRRTTIGNATGLNRRELYVDARDIQSESEGSEQPISDDYYNYLLEERGYEKLAEHMDIQTFEGSVDYSREFIYGEDYFIGDIVRISNAYGISAKVRITEVVRSQDESGYEIYPTFEVV